MLSALLLASAIVATQAAAPLPPPRLNDIQVLGSHNSYKSRIPAAVMAKLRQDAPNTARALDYYHPSLTHQLDLGLRQLEIDIFADPQGGRYAAPKGQAFADAAGEPTRFDAAAMRQPGFKVFHVPDVDYLSGCVTLRRCLGEIDAWSRAHPHHVPIMVTINANDRPSKDARIASPLALSAPLLDQLDAEIRQAIAPERLITPDEVRGDLATLREAVLADRWPTLQAARGRLYLVFDVPPDVSDRYRQGHPSLKGRAMFGLFDEASPEAATMIVQDPRSQEAQIQRWVRQGYVVRTRADANTEEARSGDLSKARAAIDSGAQAVSTDYYPGAPDVLGTGFVVRLDGPHPFVRCNPIRRPSDCGLDQDDFQARP